MNWTHLHLALKHLPVLGVPFVVVLPAWGGVVPTREGVRVAGPWSSRGGVVALCGRVSGVFGGSVWL